MPTPSNLKNTVFTHIKQRFLIYRYFACWSHFGHQNGSKIDHKTFQERLKTHHEIHHKIDIKNHRFWTPKWPQNDTKANPATIMICCWIFLVPKSSPKSPPGTTWTSFWSSFGPPGSLFDHPHLVLTPNLLPNQPQNLPQTIKKCNTKHTQKVYSKLLLCGFITTDSKRQESKRQLQGGGGGASAARRLRYTDKYIDHRRTQTQIMPELFVKQCSFT